ncbi:hypothetical protein PPL_07945 [Heterostelium album PN500]|uniref:Uncharacterized protein n=1 Tax=Heterostelium pallidum (strain ATCC 26659 / Pp 5 / PN500) TaxID=670386 RepID=D3BHE3_HETP5|nr:hypothetical protein PPL_07945 [Heterostelium album PN500]EFA79120.1 hypothetical protein PPL_07945 [Heterostelium album PN500]|eukprot:XP_020431242.1 hypothetical protein PPL_07945 [Heterostelium album PN500]
MELRLRCDDDDDDNYTLRYPSQAHRYHTMFRHRIVLLSLKNLEYHTNERKTNPYKITLYRLHINDITVNGQTTRFKNA